MENQKTLMASAVYIHPAGAMFQSVKHVALNRVITNFIYCNTVQLNHYHVMTSKNQNRPAAGKVQYG
jgi:hypothetical protein